MKWILIQKLLQYCQTSRTLLISPFHPPDEYFRFTTGADQCLGSVHIYDDHGGSFIADYMPYEAPFRASNQVALQREEAGNMVIAGGLIIATIAVLLKSLR